jgi:hypothetical protein
MPANRLWWLKSGLNKGLALFGFKIGVSVFKTGAINHSTIPPILYWT